MKIYRFSSWFAGKKLFTVEEIEVEEKPKSYVGKYTRILKSDINILTGSGNQMYCLEKDPKFYMNAVIRRMTSNISFDEEHLKIKKSTLEEWKNRLSELEQDDT